MSIMPNFLEACKRRSCAGQRQGTMESANSVVVVDGSKEDQGQSEFREFETGEAQKEIG
jgi:hypothetical protein